jgi:hypothetical protein
MEPGKAHALRPEDVLANFNVRPDVGLSTAQIEANRAKYGSNGEPLLHSPYFCQASLTVCCRV